MERATYKFYAELYNDEVSIKHVLCEIYLPEKREGNIKIKFLPSKKQVNKVEDLLEFSLKGKINGFSGKTEKIIQANKVFKQRSSRMHWEPSIVERVAFCEPLDLKITTLYRNQDKNKQQKDEIIFWITPSIYLNPFENVEKSYNGNIKIKILKKIKVSLEDNLRISFRNHYSYNKNTKGENITIIDIEAAANSKQNLYKEHKIGTETLERLDDFLNLVSLAERYRTACIGWDFYSTKRHVRFYRRNVSIPTSLKTPNELNSLIPRNYFDEFINKTYKTFTGFDACNQELIRQAIQNIVGSSLTSVSEASFKALFSALETLMLFFRKSKNLDTILPYREWKIFEKDLQKWIKNYELLSQNEYEQKKPLIYEKMSELNRISFSRVFDVLCQTYKIDLTDLWPVTNNDTGLSLAQIRNKLVHGEYFSNIQLHSLFVAKEHLKWIVERILLTILKWPIGNSQVSKTFLEKTYVFNQDWKRDKTILSL